jgi:hypothetical protein
LEKGFIMQWRMCRQYEATQAIQHYKLLHHHRVSESASAMGGMTDRTELLTLASVAQALMMGEGDCLINSIDNRRIHSTRSREVRGEEVGERRGEEKGSIKRE